MKLLSILFLFSSAVFAAEAPVHRTINDKNLKWGPCPEIFPQGCEMTVLHGAPDKPNADIYLRVPANYQLPAHTHTSPEHITVVSGEMNVKYQGSEAFKLSQGSYAYGPAGVPHQATCVGTTACVLSITFEKPVDAKPYSGKM